MNITLHEWQVNLILTALGKLHYEDVADTIADIREQMEQPDIRVEVTQSDLLGYDWERKFIGDTLVSGRYIAQDIPAGTADNPIPWYPSRELIQSAWYVHQGVKKIWTGFPGTADWNHTDFIGEKTP